MIIFLALVLIILMILIGGERGAVSLMTLAGNIVILFISILLMSIGFPALLLILAAGAGVCYNSLFYQNGNNPKTRAAFLATLLVMLRLFIPIYLIIWRSGSYGLNELQLSEDDFMYYYSTDIHINMLHVAVFVTVFSTLGAVIDTALSVTFNFSPNSFCVMLDFFLSSFMNFPNFWLSIFYDFLFTFFCENFIIFT